MYDSFSFKTRFYFLIGGGVLVYILAYWIAISGTIKIRNELKDLNVKLEEVTSAPENIASLEHNIEIANQKIGQNPSEITDFQKNMLNKISSYCMQNGLILKDFPKLHLIEGTEYQIIIGYAEIEGRFVPLLKLLYQLEMSRSVGRVVSVGFYSIEDRRLKKIRLSMKIYVQNIKLIKNAK
jgi:hypothetical protein